MPPMRQGQQIQAAAHVGQALLRTQQQQHVPGADLQFAHVLAKALRPPRDPDQRDPVTVQQPQRHRRPAGQLRGLRDHRLAQHQLLGLQDALAGADVFQAHVGDGFLDVFGLGLDHQYVARPHLHHAGQAGQTPALADQAENLDAGFLRRLVQFPHALADDRRPVLDLQLDDVVRQVEQFPGGVFLPAFRRQQAPPQQRDVRHADSGAGDADGGEIEHPERLAERVVAELGDDDVGRRADQRDHAAENRRERQRHQ